MPCKFSATDWFSKLDTCILGRPSPLSVLFSVYVHSIWFHQYNFTWLQAIAHHGLSPDSVVFPSPKGEDPVLGSRQPPSHHHSQPWDLSSNFSRSALSMSWFGYFFSCATLAGFFSGPKGGPAYTSKQLCVNILEEISFSLGWIWQFHVIQIIYKSSLGKRRNFITYILNYTLDPIKNFFSPYLTELGARPCSYRSCFLLFIYNPPASASPAQDPKQILLLCLLTQQRPFLVSLVGVHVPTFWLFIKVPFAITLWDAITLPFFNLFQIEDIITKMQDDKTGGVPVRTVKSFLSKIPSVVTGKCSPYKVLMATRKDCWSVV